MISEATIPKRPVVRYHGGKWLLAPWIIEHFPEHRIYVEPFGGAASVLIRKERSYAEIYNDLNGEMVNLFRVLRNPAEARELVRLVKLTPYSREEFDAAFIVADDPIEQARRTLFRAAAGFSTTGAQAAKWRTGFRGSVTRSGSTPAMDWMNLADILPAFTERLRGVVIESLPATDLIEKYDNPDALIYADPPYAFESRDKRWAGKVYTFEMTDDDHRVTAKLLHEVKGMVLVSGYHCDLYDKELFSDWSFVERETHADRASDRTEVLWINPAAESRLKNKQGGLW